MLLTDTQVSKFRKAFANNFSANVRLSKTQLHKIGHSKGFLGLLGAFPKALLPLMKNIIKLLTKNVRINSRSISNRFYKKMFGSGTTTLKIFNKEINDIMNS